MPKGETFVGILDTGAEEPKSKALRYVVSGIALALLLAAGLWYLLRYTTEKHTVERFMNAVVAGDSQQAYRIWHAHPGFSYQDFISFWGPNGYYSPIKSYRMESAEVPPKGGSGVVVTVELSAYNPFPKPEDTIKFAQNREVQLWVERSDQSLSFPPP
jgi:uncharacterized protein YfiM (DUF2279 family)